jgi:anti-anti-sigma regulatory factor
MTDEALHEAVTRLEQTLATERRQRDEAEALLAALHTLATAPSLAATDQALLHALQAVLGYTASVLLVLGPDGRLREQASSEPDLVGLELDPGPLLTRVLAGRPAAVFDVAQVPELAALAAVPELRSALCVGLTTAHRGALLLCVHPRAAAFSPRQTALARSFAQAAIPVLDSLGAREDVQRRRLAEARADELERSNAALHGQLDTIVRQQAQIQRLAGPVLRVWRGVVVVPLIGALDDIQISGLADRLLRALAEERARVVILDLTGLETADASTGEHLRRLVRAAALLGVRSHITGIHPDLARALATSDTLELRCHISLADGLAAALQSNTLA